MKIRLFFTHVSHNCGKLEQAAKKYGSRVACDGPEVEN